MKKQPTRIELFKESMNFSAGHFTIFSETERENLHGHNFSVYAIFESEVIENGMTFNYDIYKKIIISFTLVNPFNGSFMLSRDSSINSDSYILSKPTTVFPTLSLVGQPI